jgi:hypothetical protein
MPLFMLFFVLVGLGALIGGIAAWLKQHKWRARARHAEAMARDLRTQLDLQQLRSGVPAPPGSSPPFIVPPAA